MQDLRGKTAVVTGGASGIGLAIAELFGRQGCRLLLADIEEGALDAAVRRLKDVGIEAGGCVTDVADHASVEALARHAEEAFGPVHLLFNNAGVSMTGPTWRLSEDDWRWVWGVNVWGVVNGIRAFLPGMLAHGEPGHVINTGSLASFTGIGDHAPYCASKAAVLGLSQSLFCEMRAMMTGIGVTIVCPGMAATRIHQSWRNRPHDDAPWSEREFADPAKIQLGNEFQGRGIAPEAIAEATLDAVMNDRFYVFTGPIWQDFMADTAGRMARGDAPHILTWGEDRRPASQRAPASWHWATITQ